MSLELKVFKRKFKNFILKPGHSERLKIIIIVLKKEVSQTLDI